MIQKLQDCILSIVDEYPGIKSTELVSKIPEIYFQEDIDLVQTLSDLVSSEQLIELKYVLSNQPYRVKTMYFLSGTLLVINK